MSGPALLKVGLLLVLVLLCGGISWGVVTLALPRSEWVEIGKLADFPPADQPYEVFTPVHVFVANDGEQLLVLDPMNQVPRGFKVWWQAKENAFIDPNRGSAFNYLGMPIRRFGSQAPVENQSLPRYGVKVEGDAIYFDLKQMEVVAVPGN